MNTETTRTTTARARTTNRTNDTQTTHDTQETAMKTQDSPKKTRSHAAPIAATLDALAADCAVREPGRASQWNSLYVQLLETLRPELDAVAPETLLTVNVDIPTAIHFARSALPVLELLRPRVAALGDADLKKYDRVGDYARLLQYAHGCYLATIETPDDVSQTYEECVRARDFLLAWCPGLVAAKLLPQALIDQVRPGIGFQDAITDITTLTGALRAIWPTIEGKTLITAALLDETDALAEKLAQGVARRDSHVETITKRATDRQIAFTLFARAYAEARATVIYLRRNQGDGEKLVPSIYTKAPGARRKEAPAEPTPVQPTEDQPANPAQPVAAPVRA